MKAEDRIDEFAGRIDRNWINLRDLASRAVNLLRKHAGDEPEVQSFLAGEMDDCEAERKLAQNYADA